MRRAFTLLLVLALACLTLAAGQVRKVKPGDVVTVQCDEEATLNKQYTIDKGGFIILPMVGALQVAGLNETDASAKISDALVNGKMLPRAGVTLKINNSKNGVITFAGAVKNAGEIAPKDGLHIEDIVKQAQPAPNANLSRIRVITGAGNEFIVNYAAYDGKNYANNPDVVAGDTVYFDAAAGSSIAVLQNPTMKTEAAKPTLALLPNPTITPVAPIVVSERASSAPVVLNPRFVTVMGRVGTPRYVPYVEGMTVASAIKAAGGTLPNASAKVRVERKIDGATRVYTENEKDVAHGMAGPMALRANDVVSVRRMDPDEQHILIIALIVLAVVLLLR